MKLFSQCSNFIPHQGYCISHRVRNFVSSYVTFFGTILEICYICPRVINILFFHFFSFMVLGFVSLVVVFGGWGLWLPFLELGFLVDWAKGLWCWAFWVFRV